MSYLLVFLGGGVGSICRFGIAELMKGYNLHFPLATLIANLLSSVLLGILFSFLETKSLTNAWWYYAMMIGFCGGFSTFSSFSLDNFKLLQEGAYLLFCINVLGSVIVCLLGLFVGYSLVK